VTEGVINKPDTNHIVKADLVLRSRRQSHDNNEVVDIPLGDIKDGVFSA
jgi:hypothetical protein